MYVLWSQEVLPKLGTAGSSPLRSCLGLMVPNEPPWWDRPCSYCLGLKLEQIQTYQSRNKSTEEYYVFYMILVIIRSITAHLFCFTEIFFSFHLVISDEWFSVGTCALRLQCHKIKCKINIKRDISVTLCRTRTKRFISSSDFLAY